MSEPAETLAPAPPCTDELLRQAVEELRACRAANEAARREQGHLPELVLTAHRLAELQDVLRQVAMQQTLAEVKAAAEPEPELKPARNRDRAPRARHASQERPLRAVRGILPAGGLVAALRHSWAAHPVATAATGFTAATLATAAVVAPHAGVTLPFGTSTSATPNPPASVVAATPLLQPGSPSSPRVALALTRPKPNSVTSSPLVFPPAVSPVQGPGDGQEPAPEPSSQDGAPQVRLVVTQSLDLGLQPSGTIRLAAFGGPADWSAQASDAGMMLDQSSGSLEPGDSTVIRVSITADLQALAGPGSVTISYDGQERTIPVTWTVIPLPAPSPSDAVPSEVASILPPVLGS